MMKLKPGMVFASHYEVVRVISAGGMGVVYEVTHRGTQRNRALKVMLPHVLEDEEMRNRFALEAVVTANIESEHLVEVFDAGIDPESESPYIVMELLRGNDVGKRLERGGRYSEAEVMTYIEQISRALEKTHARGIIHRDLKPENLFITKRDDGSVRIKVLDFGIAKLIKTTDAGNPKNTTRSFGTPYYVPREQLTGQAKLIGPASDLYSLAHIVYTMLVGLPYFDGDEGTEANVLTLLNAVGKGTVEPASARAKRQGATLPEGFDEWFAQATDLDPKKRFQTAIDFANSLGKLLDPSRVELEPAGGSLAPRGLRTGAGTTRRADASAPTLPDLSQPSTLAQSTDMRSEPPKAEPPPARAIAGSSQAFSTSSLPGHGADGKPSKRRAVIAALGVVAVAGVTIAVLQSDDEAPAAGATSGGAVQTARSTAGPTVTVVDVPQMDPTVAPSSPNEATTTTAPPSASSVALTTAAPVRTATPTTRKTAGPAPSAPPAVTATTTAAPTTTVSSRPERIR